MTRFTPAAVPALTLALIAGTPLSAAGPATVAAPLTGISVPAASAPTPAAYAAPARLPSTTATITITGVSSKRAVKVTLRGPHSYRNVMTLTGAVKKATVPRLRVGMYTLTAGDLASTSSVLYPSKALSRFTVAATRAAPVVTVAYRRAVLTFTGVANLRLGMTFAQAKTANPAMKGTKAVTCTLTPTPYGSVVFAANGRVVYIGAAANVPTLDGLRINDTFAQASAIYLFTRHTFDFYTSYSYIRVSPSFRARRGVEATTTPLLGITFDPWVTITDELYDFADGHVSRLFLDNGQNCWT